MIADLLPTFVRDYYEVHEWRHAGAILAHDFAAEWDDLLATLTSFRLLKQDILTPGGNDSVIAKKLNDPLRAHGWVERSFRAREIVEHLERTAGSSRDLTVVRADELAARTHKVDCFKNEIAVEVEWNNKDPFFARDLSNFRLLYDLRVASVGVIITRCDALQDIFNMLGRGASFGASTTHMSKLLPHLYGGAAGGCPVLVFGISSALYVEGTQP